MRPALIWVGLLATGFAAAGTLQNLWFALIGCTLGTLIGVLPGIGPIPTIASLLPAATSNETPSSACTPA